MKKYFLALTLMLSCSAFAQDGYSANVIDGVHPDGFGHSGLTADFTNCLLFTKNGTLPFQLVDCQPGLQFSLIDGDIESGSFAVLTIVKAADNALLAQVRVGHNQLLQSGQLSIGTVATIPFIN